MKIELIETESHLLPCVELFVDGTKVLVFYNAYIVNHTMNNLLTVTDNTTNNHIAEMPQEFNEAIEQRKFDFITNYAF